MSNPTGTLFVIATPIGNLEDISARALTILSQVEYIAAEDTRQSKKLLNHYNINTQLISHHKFNERKSEPRLLQYLQAGDDIALISDAGTPLICDPGAGIVKTCHEKGINVVPVPGPSALITALSASGFAADRFVFEGFLPEKKSMRRKLLTELCNESRTMVFYETPHRILSALDDMVDLFSPDQPVFIARELTKKFETLYSGSISNIKELLTSEVSQQKGEFVIVVNGVKRPDSDAGIDSQKLITTLLRELPLSKASGIAAEITGESKNSLYKLGLTIQNKQKR